MKKFVALVLSLLLCGVFFMPAVTCAEEKTKIVMWDFWYPKMNTSAQS